MSKILQFINLIRGPYQPADGILTEEDTSAGIMVEVFTNGNCGNFAQALVLAFGGSVVYVEEARHIVAEIDGRLWDITGDVTEQYGHMYNTIPSPSKLEDMTGNYSFAERGPLV